MTIANDNTNLNIIVSKNIKHKLKLLADSENMKLSSFAAQKLQEVVEEFEHNILDLFGHEKFLDKYYELFGEEHPPLIEYRPIKSAITKVRVKDAIRTILNKNKHDFIPLSGNLDDILFEADKKKEPSE